VLFKQSILISYFPEREHRSFNLSHLEFSAKAWSPWTETEKACLEKVQQAKSGEVSVGTKQCDLRGQTADARAANPLKSEDIYCIFA
jgi:hypothetical protein